MLGRVAFNWKRMCEVCRLAFSIPPLDRGRTHRQVERAHNQLLAVIELISVRVHVLIHDGALWCLHSTLPTHDTITYRRIFRSTQHDVSYL